MNKDGVPALVLAFLLLIPPGYWLADLHSHKVPAESGARILSNFGACILLET